MTAVVVGFLVAAAVLLWSVAGGAAGRSSLAPRVGAHDPTGIAAGPAPRRWSWLATRRRRRRAERAEAEALELLDGLAPALRAGLPPVTALRLVTSSRLMGITARSPTPARNPARSPPQSPPQRSRPGRPGPSSAGGSGWIDLDAAAARGDPLAPAWSAYADAVDSEDLRLVAAAWSLCETLGSPVAPTVATVAEVVRRRRAVRHRITAALAGPQATMRVLTALPLSGPFVAVLVGVSPSELYADAAGLSSLVAGVTLLVVGRVWAARMVRAVALEQPARAGRRDRRASRAHR